MRLLIKNETHFSTRALRGIITAVYRHVAKEEGRELGGLRVQVGYARTWGQAHGALGYGSLTLFFRKSHHMEFEKDAALPNGGRWFRPKGHPEPSVAYVAGTVRHELMHNYGYHHTKRGMQDRAAIGWFYDRALPAALLDALTAKWGPRLTIHVPRTVTVRDPRAERRARARAALERWERKLKYAQNKVAHYVRSVRRYELLDKLAGVPTLPAVAST